MRAIPPFRGYGSCHMGIVFPTPVNILHAGSKYPFLGQRIYFVRLEHILRLTKRYTLFDKGIYSTGLGDILTDSPEYTSRIP